MLVGGVKGLSGQEIDGPAASVREPLAFGQIGFAAPQRFFGTLLLCQVEYERDRVVPVSGSIECRAADQHGDAAAVLLNDLFLEGAAAAGRSELCCRALIAIVPLSRRQVRPADATRDEIVAAVSH